MVLWERAGSRTIERMGGCDGVVCVSLIMPQNKTAARRKSGVLDTALAGNCPGFSRKLQPWRLDPKRQARSPDLAAASAVLGGVDMCHVK